ncbi:MAG: polyprenyl synthetase family protein [Xanthobacteraceae bacterium]|nr:MAG: polyprenyl synthetase family protein [Xanthobacteraceae bacterium]
MVIAVRNSFSTRLASTAAAVEGLFARLLDATPLADEIARPARLIEAMRHASLGGGKRLRPFLVVESAALFDVPAERALMAAAALECVHCYSLAHDDLPAMDDSDLRRGRPAVHRAFDEATAILAGDALLTLAFDVISRDEVHPNAEVRVALSRLLARTAGIGGMAGGQMLDLEGEGRFGAAAPPDIAQLQAMKTGTLLRFACVAGALLGEAPSEAREALDIYGRAFGEAFQIADDLLDVEGDAVALGKTTGQDAAAGKATSVSVLGIAGARARLAELTARADAALDRFGARADLLRDAARFVVERKS